jgi:hypothetical protein
MHDVTVKYDLFAALDSKVAIINTKIADIYRLALSSLLATL